MLSGYKVPYNPRRSHLGEDLAVSSVLYLAVDLAVDLAVHSAVYLVVLWRCCGHLHNPQPQPRWKNSGARFGDAFTLGVVSM